MEKTILYDLGEWEVFKKENIDKFLSSFRPFNGNNFPESYPCIVIHKIIHTSYDTYPDCEFVYPYDFE